MTTTEQSILDTLLELERAVATLRTATPKPDLGALFQKLDQLAAQLPKGTDPELTHYLHRKSYEKARLWLEGRGAENKRGNCGN